MDPSYVWDLVFRLGGEYRQCHLVEFAWRMSFYPVSESISPRFPLFLQDASWDFAAGNQDIEFENWLLIIIMIHRMHNSAT